MELAGQRASNPVFALVVPVKACRTMALCVKSHRASMRETMRGARDVQRCPVYAQ